MFRNMRYALLLLPALLGSALAQDCETPAAAPVAKVTDASLGEALESARQDLVISRTEFKRCAKVEQDVLKDAREVVYRKTPLGQAMPVALSAAADLMESAAAQAGKPAAKLCADMAASYRAMARELDRKERHLNDAQRALKPAERAADTYAKAREALLAPAGDPHPAAEDSWSVVKRGDPQFRALARNMKALDAAWAALDADCGKACGECAEGTDAPGCCTGKVALLQAKELLAKVQPAFADVQTERPEAPPAAVPT